MMSKPSNPFKGVIVTFSSATISATCSTCLFQPFDLVKTRLQTAANMKRFACIAAPSTAPSSLMGTVGYVIRTESYRGLWKGTTPSMFRSVPSIAVYFTTLHTMASMIGKQTSELSAVESFSIGLAARSCIGIGFLPFTVIKARYESGIFEYRGVMQAITAIWKTEGGRGLYGGLTATLLRDAPFSGLYLAFYTQGKKALNSLLGTEQLPSFCNLPCGVAAGILASGVTQPADVVKTKLQTKVAQNLTTRQVFVDIMKNEGVRGLFHGMMPRMLRRTFMAAFTWAFYEEIVKAMKSASRAF